MDRHSHRTSNRLLRHRTDRRNTWRCLALVGVALLGGCSRKSAERPPSLILISIDTLRFDHLHCYGYERETSPTLDALAAAGVRFEQHISNTSWTLPSHASMLTGLAETVHGVDDDFHVLDPARTTLAEILHAEGYRTAGFFSGPYLHPTYGFGQGFDVYESAITLRRPKDRESVWHLVNNVDRVRLIERNSYQQRTGPELVARATAWLDSLDDDEPFFLFLHFFDCHWDYMPPEEYWRKFDPDYDDPSFDGREFLTNPAIHPGMSERHLEHLLARYDGEILFTDEMVRQLLSHTERLGRRDHTLISVTADHGEEFFEHGEKGHRNNLFDESIRIPWILSWPGHIPTGTTVPQTTSIVDVTPTLLRLLGYPTSDEMTGRNVAPLFLGEPPTDLADQLAFGSLVWGPGQTMSSRFLRRERSKLFVNRGADTDIASLAYYDLVADPNELHPKTGDSRHIPPPLQGPWERFQAVESDHGKLRSRLRLDRPDAKPTLNEELILQLQQNGYLSDH